MSDQKRFSHLVGPSGSNFAHPPQRQRISALFHLGLALTCVNLYFLGRSHTSAGSPEPSSPARHLEDSLVYINSKDADPACGVCLDAGRKYFEEKRLKALEAATSGMALVPDGNYRIGSPDNMGDPDEHPSHTVKLGRYYIDKHEVTGFAYLKFVAETGGNHPEWLRPGGKFNIETGTENYYKRLSGRLKSEKHPVVGVSWKDADAYCRHAGKRLPTEAEWEAAARAGAATAYHFGEDVTHAASYAWLETNSSGVPHRVGEKKSNAFGLYDMHGNVWEWVSDYYAADYYSRSPKHSPRGPEAGTEHVIRGGSWAFDADSSRLANRASYAKANDDIGFRCAVSERELISGSRR